MDLEGELDKFLKIKTNGRDDSNSNYTNYPYEATPYSVLELLSNSGYITKKDKIIDFGSGKGRVDFYLAFSTKATMIGIEYDERLYNSSLLNLKNTIYPYKIFFNNICASQYIISDDITGAYFFNPFNLKIFNKVINNLKESIIRNNREIKLFFYYPSKEYLEYLNNDNNIIYIDNIDCSELFNNDDKREYIAIYKMIK